MTYWLETTQFLLAPPSLIWQRLTALPNWPSWWPQLKEVFTLEDASANQPTYRLFWHSPYGYVFTTDCQLHLGDTWLELCCPEITGFIRFSLHPHSGGSSLRISWNFCSPGFWLDPETMSRICESLGTLSHTLVIAKRGHDKKLV